MATYAYILCVASKANLLACPFSRLLGVDN